MSGDATNGGAFQGSGLGTSSNTGSGLNPDLFDGLNAGQPGGVGGLGSGGGAAASGLGGVASGASTAFNMIGDMGPSVYSSQVPGFPQPPKIPPTFPPGKPTTIPNPRARSLITASVRGLKISENQSPLPQDRIFVGFNYFGNVNRHLDNVFSSSVDNLNVWREIFGFEKTFNDGKGSFGIRLPLDTIHADARPGQALGVPGQSTALGNVTVFGKYIMAMDQKSGSLISVGLAVSPATAPSRFAGAQYLLPSNTTSIQPFLGYLWNFGSENRAFIQGFTAIDVPSTYSLPTLTYNDIGLGYRIYTSDDDSRFLTAVVPTFEAHVNAPINHRDAYSLTDKYGTPNVVNLLGGVNLNFFRSTTLSLGVVTPATGPKPFDAEGVAQLNIYYGATKRRQSRATPVIGN